MNKNSIILLAILLLSCLGIFSPTINIAFADEPEICTQLNLHLDDECNDNQPLPDIPCCSEVDPLVWDHANSAEVISESASVVTVTGGVLPRTGEILSITWKINGNGFYFDVDHTVTELTTKDRSVNVYRTAEACSAEISVSDGCPPGVSETVRGAGGWVLMPEGFDPGITIPFNGDDFSEGYGPTGCSVSQRFSASHSIYRVEQLFCRHSESDNAQRYSTCEAACAATKTIDELYSDAKEEMANLPEYPEIINTEDIFTKHLIPHRVPPTWSSYVQ